MRELKEVEVKLNETPDKQISLTDPDARSMKTRGNGIVVVRTFKSRWMPNTT